MDRATQQPELLEHPTPVAANAPPPEGDGDGDVQQALRQEASILRLWGANRAILRCLPPLLGSGPFARPVTFLDVGVGTGLFAIDVVRWFRAAQVPVQVLGVDFEQDTVDYAREATQGYPEIQIERADLDLEKPLPESSAARYDFVIVSQLARHLPDGDCCRILRYLYAQSRCALLVGEVVRHPCAYPAMWLWTRVTLRCPATRRELPARLLRAKSIDDWWSVFQQAGVPVVGSYPAWPSLVCFVAPKSAEGVDVETAGLEAIPSIAHST